MFDKEYDTIDLTGATGFQLDLSNGPKTVTFALPEKVDIFNLPMYFSPKLNELQIGNSITLEDLIK